MPGLADMHVHIKEENELLLFVANGVTTVRDMWGTTGFQLWLGFPDQLTLREQINQGQLFGPTIYAAGPIMEGTPPTMPLMPVFETPAEAEKSVAWQAAQGYDFVKENPLEDVTNVGKRVGVMLRGYWLPEAQLQGMLGELVDSYAPRFIERVWLMSLIALGLFLILRRLI